MTIARPVMNFGELFAKTLSSVHKEREEATRQLEQAAKDNLAVYVVCLVRELANENQQVDLRIAAGLALKNILTARDYSTRQVKQQGWLQLPSDARLEVKTASLQTLASSQLRASMAASQVIAAIAAAELPNNQWPDLINFLLQNVTSGEASVNLKQSTLQTIGFICEEIPLDILETQANSILTAIIQGARKEEQSVQVRLAAIKALSNSLDFIRKNFENQGERDFIMQVVCEATATGNDELAVAAFECLVKIISTYYDKMGYYMEQALFQMTINGMKNKNPDIVLQAVEFWSSICETEKLCLDEMEEAKELGEEPKMVSLYFAIKALPEIVPTLLWLLTKQDEDAEEDDWNPSMAAGLCLSLFAECVRDQIVGQVVPFVEQNIRNQDWRYREAAVMAFGSILDGPSSEMIEPLVAQAIAVIIEMMKDPVVHVKDTAAWTLGRICELHPTCIAESVIEVLVSSLLSGLEDSTRVAYHCAWALSHLSQHLGVNGEELPTCALSRYFDHIVSGLLNAANRNDATESSLRTSAYESLSVVISNSAHDTLPVIERIIVVTVERLEASIDLETQLLSTEDKVHNADLQTSLSGIIQSVSKKVGRSILGIADRIMRAFMVILQSSNKSPTVMEDVFLSIGTLISVLEADFSRYTQAFVPFVYSALQKHEEHQLCSIAVGIVGDLARALNDGILPFCNDLMALLLQNLQSGEVHRDVKPAIVSCFGDISLAIQSKFSAYLPHVMGVLEQAATITAPENDYDMMDYVDILRESILEAYTGLVQGFKAENKQNLMLPYIQQMVVLINIIQQDANASEPVIRGAVGLIGDLVSSFGTDCKNYLLNEWVEKLLKDARSGRMSASTKETAKWAKGLLKQL